jgi:hypothetical protein
MNRERSDLRLSIYKKSREKKIKKVNTITYDKKTIYIYNLKIHLQRKMRFPFELIGESLNHEHSSFLNPARTLL